MSPITIATTSHATLRESISSAVMPSGLEVVFCPKPGFRKQFATYSTYYGSVDRDFIDASGDRVQVPDGIAHFLEHCLFETDRGNVSELFEANGADSNASTSQTTTTYLFSSSDRFWDNLALLVDFVENPSFRTDKVDKERGIIEQEIAGYDDSPDWVAYRTLLESLFHAHPMRIDIAGTAESIAAIDARELDRCYDTFYRRPNMTLFVTGDLDSSELFEFIAARSKGDRRPGGKRECFFPREEPSVAERRRELRMEVAVPKMYLGFKEVDIPDSGREYALRELSSDMALEILFSKSGPIYGELYDARLIYSDFGASYGLGAGVAFGMVGGDTPDPAKLESTVLRRLEELRREGLREVDFEREKKRFIGGTVRGFHSLEYIAGYYTYYRFHGFDLFEAVDLLRQVTREEVEARIEELLDPDRVATVTVLPQE